jgi:hypothetical protein
MRKKKRGPKSDPIQGPRQRIIGYSRGPIVSPRTNRLLSIWNQCYGLPIGRMIDDLMSYAASKPDFQLSTEGIRMRRNPTIHRS